MWEGDKIGILSISLTFQICMTMSNHLYTGDHEPGKVWEPLIQVMRTGQFKRYVPCLETIILINEVHLTLIRNHPGPYFIK